MFVAGMAACTQYQESHKDYDKYKAERSFVHDAIEKYSLDHSEETHMAMNIHFDQDTMVYSFRYLKEIDEPPERWQELSHNSCKFLKGYTVLTGVNYIRVRMWNTGQEVYNFTYKIREEKFDLIKIKKY